MNKIKNLLKGILLGAILCMALVGCTNTEKSAYDAYKEMNKAGVIDLQGMEFKDVYEQMPEKDREIFCNILLDLYNDVYLESFENGEFSRYLYDINLYIYTMEYDDLKQFMYEKYEKEYEKENGVEISEPKFTKADLYQEFTLDSLWNFSNATIMIGGFKTYEGKYVPASRGGYYYFCDCLGNCYTESTECDSMFSEDVTYNEHYGAHREDEGHGRISLSSICQLIESAVINQLDSYSINIECFDCGHITSIDKPGYEFYNTQHICENCNSENIFGRINGLVIDSNSWIHISKPFTGDYDVIINFNNSTKIYELLDEEVLENNIDTTLL